MYEAGNKVQAIQAELHQAQLALAVKQEDLTRLNKDAAAQANELGANKQVLYLKTEAGRKLARKVELLQETEARATALEHSLPNPGTDRGCRRDV